MIKLQKNLLRKLFLYSLKNGKIDSSKVVLWERLLKTAKQNILIRMIFPSIVRAEEQIRKRKMKKIELENRVKNRAFVIGNGGTRENLNLSSLEGFGTIYGCNALYRDYEPDVLVALDPGIIKEILASDFPREKLFVPPMDQQYEPAQYNPHRPRENAGMVACRHAIESGAKELFLFGFDFVLENYDANLSNVYNGTKNYGPETKCSFDDTKRRARYFEWFAHQNPGVKFYFCFPQNLYNYRKMNVPNGFICFYNDLEVTLKEEKAVLAAH